MKNTPLLLLTLIFSLLIVPATYAKSDIKSDRAVTVAEPKAEVESKAGAEPKAEAEPKAVAKAKAYEKPKVVTETKVHK